MQKTVYKYKETNNVILHLNKSIVFSVFMTNKVIIIKPTRAASDSLLLLLLTLMWDGLYHTEASGEKVKVQIKIGLDV